MLIALTTRLVKHSGHYPKFPILPVPTQYTTFRLSSGLQAIQQFYVLCKTLNISKTSHRLRERWDKKLQLLCERFSLKNILNLCFYLWSHQTATLRPFRLERAMSLLIIDDGAIMRRFATCP